MAADVSRILYDALDDRTGVELKQGGLLLDADFNELGAIIDRRLRALASDVLGRSTRGANTPDAFRIVSTGPGFTIDPGRLYVDGHLADNHGSPPHAQFDNLLSESCSPQPVPYDTQPYMPEPAPTLPEAGRHLVYLDVWQREVTHVEDPSFVEGAVGVDTSARLQTVWQVKVLDDEAGASATCTTPDAEIVGWEDVIAASEGRLTTGTYEVAAVTDPCELPPSGGYRGLENQLYRVEIHDPGDLGVATFKWSRDNGSVASRVASIVSTTVLELDSLGRDDVLHFYTDDWVEVLDDNSELSQESGEIRKITVDEANRRITLSSALPGTMAPGPFPNSDYPRTANLRVRKWDQKGIVRSAGVGGATAVHQDLDASPAGVITVPTGATQLLLENGITVSFSTVGTRGFRSGDYWTFAARTGDASIELLDAAPPRGVHHHYARLAFWNVGDVGPLPQCPLPWPPQGGHDCSCGQCVTPESHANGTLTIADAVNQVREKGGTVCLAAGQYTLEQSVPVSGAQSVRIRGQGLATVIVAPAGAFAIADSRAITVENLSIISAGRPPLISARGVLGLTLQELTMLAVSIEANTGAAGIVLAGGISDLTIRENLIVASEGIRAFDPTADNPRDILVTLSMRIDDNVLWCDRQAIRFSGMVGHLLESRICGNEIIGCREGGIDALGVTLPGASMRVAGNNLNVNGAGIRCGVDGAWIESNKLLGRMESGRQRTSSGTAIALIAGLDESGSDQCQVLANQISGFTEAGILIDAPVTDLIVKQNIIEQCLNGIVMTPAAIAGSVSIENNHLRDIGPRPGEELTVPTIFGISAARADSVALSGNTVNVVGANANPAQRVVAGIAADSVRKIRVAANQVAEVAGNITLLESTVAGILARAPFRQVEITGNQVERDALPAADATRWWAVLIEHPIAQRPVRFADFTAIHIDELTTLVIQGEHAYVSKFAALATASISAASLRHNVLSARGDASVVELTTNGNAQLADNRCELRRGTGSPAVMLRSTSAVISANVIEGGENSLVSQAAAARTTLVGNATTGKIAIAGVPPVAPWNQLNIGI